MSGNVGGWRWAEGGPRGTKPRYRLHCYWSKVALALKWYVELDGEVTPSFLSSGSAIRNTWAYFSED